MWKQATCMWYKVVSKFIWRLKVDKSLTSHFLMTLVANPNICHESPSLSSSILILSKRASSQFTKNIMTIRKYFLKPPSSLPISVTLPHCKYSGKYYFLNAKSNIYKSVLLIIYLYSLELDYFFLETFCSLELSDLTAYFSPMFLAIFSQFSLFLLVQVEFSKILVLKFIFLCIKFSSLDYYTKLILQPDTKIQ